jgi:hypothetical protein
VSVHVMIHIFLSVALDTVSCQLHALDDLSLRKGNWRSTEQKVHWVVSTNFRKEEIA